MAKDVERTSGSDIKRDVAVRPATAAIPAPGTDVSYTPVDVPSPHVRPRPKEARFQALEDAVSALQEG